MRLKAPILIALVVSACGGSEPRPKRDAAPVFATVTATDTSTNVAKFDAASSPIDASVRPETADFAPERLATDTLIAAPDAGVPDAVPTTDVWVRQNDVLPNGPEANDTADARPLADLVPPERDAPLPSDVLVQPDVSIQPDRPIVYPPWTPPPPLRDAPILADRDAAESEANGSEAGEGEAGGSEAGESEAGGYEVLPPPSPCLKVSMKPFVPYPATPGYSADALILTLEACSASSVTITDMTLRFLIKGNTDNAFSPIAKTDDGHTYGVTDVVQHIMLWDGDVQLKTLESFASSGDVTFSSMLWTIPAGEAKTLVVRVIPKQEIGHSADWDKLVLIGDLLGGGSDGDGTGNISAWDGYKNPVPVTGKSPGAWSETDFHLQAGMKSDNPDELPPSDQTVTVNIHAGRFLFFADHGENPSSVIGTFAPISVTRIVFSSIGEAFRLTRLAVTNTGSSRLTGSQIVVRLMDSDGFEFCAGVLGGESIHTCVNNTGLLRIFGGQVVTITAENTTSDFSSSGSVSGSTVDIGLYLYQGEVEESGEYFMAQGESTGITLRGKDVSDFGEAGFYYSRVLADDDSSEDDTVITVTGNPFVIRKAVPQVNSVPIEGNLVNGENVIYRFTIAAPPTENVAWHKVSIWNQMTGAGLTGNSVRLRMNGALVDPSLYSVVNNMGHDISGTSVNMDNLTQITLATELVVTADTTDLYEVVATLSGGVEGDTIRVAFLSDEGPTQIPFTGTIDEVKNSSNYFFIWSDMSHPEHAAAPNTSPDWTNGNFLHIPFNLETRMF